MRTFIADQLGISTEDEFQLLAALGHDLPGAVIAERIDKAFSQGNDLAEETEIQAEQQTGMQFSLAGVQIKFSMLKEKSWFTLSKNQLPGNYIIKTPSLLYSKVPANEYSMMKLAQAVGIDAPEVQLIKLEQLQALPAINLPNEQFAYAVKRFDRGAEQLIHIEDFAQALNLKPQQKYQATNYETMARLLYEVLPDGKQAVIQFIRRLIFNILIGNTDAHLKNWSLIYKDSITPTLAPAYDLVSTLPYLQNRNLALNFAKQKSFYAISKEQLRYFAKRISLQETLVLDTAEELLERFRSAWQAQAAELPINNLLRESLEAHWKRLNF
jgi:serine/threonine-protein kinase HipA